MLMGGWDFLKVLPMWVWYYIYSLGSDEIMPNSSNFEIRIKLLEKMERKGRCVFPVCITKTDNFSFFVPKSFWPIKKRKKEEDRF